MIMLSVGEMLRKRREETGITLKQIEKEIRVREKFLRFIEENDWQYFASKVYIIGIIKTYSNALGLDPAKMLAYFRRDYEKHEDLRFKKRVNDSSFNLETKKIIMGVVAGIILIFSAYFTYQVKLYLTPPSITILKPDQTTLRNMEKVQIMGKTEKEANIVIFGDKVFVDSEGVFTYDFPLKKGQNTFIIEVTGANGKKSILKKQFLLE